MAPTLFGRDLAGDDCNARHRIPVSGERAEAQVNAPDKTARSRTGSSDGYEVEMAATPRKRTPRWVGHGDPADSRGLTAIAESYGQHLRRELRARNWTLRYCALRSGVDHTTISRLVRGTRVPSLETARRLDEAFDGPAGSLGPARGTDSAAVDPLKRLADALKHDPALDRHSVDRVLRYYAHIRSRTQGPPPPDADDHLSGRAGKTA
jgi:transcriptional regulator with XRE-family HTH domain